MPFAVPYDPEERWPVRDREAPTEDDANALRDAAAEKKERRREARKKRRANRTGAEEAQQKQAARERMQAVRDARSAEQRETANNVNRESMQAARAALSEEQRAAANNADRERKQEARAAQSDEQRAAANNADRERMQAARAAQSDEQRTAANNADRERMRAARAVARAAQSDEQRTAANNADRERMRAARAAQSDEQRAAANNAARQRMRAARAAQSEEQRHAANEAARERMRLLRTNPDYIRDERRRRRQRRLERQQEINQLPIGARCNMDYFDSTDIPAFCVDGEGEFECFYCGAKGYNHHENQGTGIKPHMGRLCCGQGMKVLPPLPPILEGIEALLSGETEMSRRFLRNPRYYNNTMALASVQANDATVRNSGPSAFRVSGQLYRRTGPLQNAEGVPPVAGQTYFHDPEFQSQHRATRSGTRSEEDIAADREIYEHLRRVLQDEANNLLIQSYKTIGEYIEENDLNPEEYAVVLLDKVPTDQHPGRFNLPTAPEIALLLMDDVPVNAQSKVVVVSVRDNGEGNSLQFIPYEHVHYETLMYPLLFPDGRATRWHPDLRSTAGKKVSLAAYVRYHMQEFNIRENHMLRFNKLWQQYILDMFERYESYKLQYLRSDAGQKQIRADLYKGVADNVEAGDGNLDQMGKSTILPASFTCSDRWYHKRYMNAMALVGKYGKPTFFLTFTMDVNCPEITSKLRRGQTAYDRPHLVNRIFQGKRKQLIDEITKKNIFGRPIAHVHVVEFQKRGAPHLHLLIWIDDFDPTPEALDNIICAEIPPPFDPLHKPVTKLMIHGPCGATYDKMNLSCIKTSTNGTCKRNYPRDFSNETSIEHGDFGVLRRRSPTEGGYTTTKKLRIRGEAIDVELDNRWVVSYNPYLLKRFGCHINVEYCATVLSVKYLFLYHFKGGDKVTIEERDRNDECKNHQTRRYLSCIEADYKLCHYDMSLIQPPVLQLPVHLPGEQQVYFQPNEQDIRAALERAKITELTAYFKANADNMYSEYTETFARDLKYEEFPGSFVFGKDGDNNKAWVERQRGPGSIGRMITMHPKRGETFYLRLLLKHTKGASSFESLRTVDSVLHETFRGACIALDLCENDVHWFETMAEAEQISSARSIRDLFANILLHCEPSEPLALFTEYCDCMKDDFKRTHQTTMSEAAAEERAHNDLLIFINNKCKDEGLENKHFHIPMPVETQEEDNMGTPADEIDENAGDYVTTNENLLNTQQQYLVQRVSERIQSDQQGLFRLDSPGGTGKTFTSNYLLAMVRQEGQIAIATALSGIASTLLTQGTTFHKRFAAPIPCFKDSTSNIKGQTIEARVIRQAQLIIVDEVSMMSYKLLDVLDRLLQDLMKNSKPMGGKTVLLLYDFRQLLPVVPGKGRGDVVSESVINSSVWECFEELSLQQNMRVQAMINQHPDRETELRQHEQWLLELGTGTIETVHSNIIEIPSQMYCETRQELEDKVFDNFLQNYTNPLFLLNRAIMSTTNDIIQQCNFELIEKIPGPMLVSESRDSCVNDDDATMYDEAVLNRINVSGVPPHRLALKVGACIILIKNLNVRDQHCNGTRYIIESMTNRLIVAKRLKDNEQLLIPRIPIISNESNFPIPFKRLQFPVLGAYYLTINRAQGQSLLKSGLYLEKSVFGHGALYVAKSRAGAPWNKYIHQKQDEFKHLGDYLDLKNQRYTRNVVYEEMFN